MGLCSALGFGSFIQEQIFLRTCPVPGPEEKAEQKGATGIAFVELRVQESRDHKFISEGRGRWGVWRSWTLGCGGDVLGGEV